MNSSRILQIVTRSDWGGAAQVVKLLANRTDYPTEVACGPGGRLIPHLRNDGIPVHVQPHLRSPPTLVDVLAYRDLKSLIKEGNYDLIHCHSTKAGALGRLAANRLDIPAVFTVHGWGFYNTEYPIFGSIVELGEQFLVDRTDEIVCVCETDRREGIDRGILDLDEGNVIYNGIPVPSIPDDPPKLRDVFGISPDIPVIGTIARLEPQKNPLKLLQIVREIDERGHEISCVIIGAGPLIKECRDFVKENGLSNVFLPGFRENAMNLLPDFDTFLLTSRFEGFPLSVLECLHLGVPVVAHDVGGVSEAIYHGKTGILVHKRSSPGEFADQVISLLEDSKQRDEMSSQAKEIARSRFTANGMCEDYQGLYNTILNG